jgi:hypothetical protein
MRLLENRGVHDDDQGGTWHTPARKSRDAHEAQKVAEGPARG